MYSLALGDCSEFLSTEYAPLFLEILNKTYNRYVWQLICHKENNTAQLRLCYTCPIVCLGQHRRHIIDEGLEVFHVPQPIHENRCGINTNNRKNGIKLLGSRDGRNHNMPASYV